MHEVCEGKQAVLEARQLHPDSPGPRDTCNMAKGPINVPREATVKIHHWAIHSKVLKPIRFHPCLGLATLARLLLLLLYLSILSSDKIPEKREEQVC